MKTSCRKLLERAIVQLMVIVLMITSVDYSNLMASSIEMASEVNLLKIAQA